MKSAEGQYLDAARNYREMGFALVPTKGKDAFLRGWEKGGIPPEKDCEYWSNGHALNIGLVLGSASGGLVDLDRDKPTDNLKPIGKMFLPDTLASGRGERPHSHFWYFCEGLESRALYDANGKKFLEVRADGHQTVVWPSVHPEGDRYHWHGKLKEIAKASPGELNRAINEWATALLLAMHMPPVGARHDYALAAAGYLLRNGRLDAETVERILLGAWHAAKADGQWKTAKEVQDAAFDTAERVSAGEEVKGGGALGELVEELPKRIAKIWKWGRTKPAVGAAPPADPETVGMTKLLADAITANEHFAQDAGGKLYRFSEGVYKQFAERFTKRRVKELVEEWGETKRWSAHRANEVTEYIRADAPVLWEAPPLDEINLKNGILNIWSRRLREHDPAFLSTVQIPVEYNPAAACPEWDKFVAATFPRDAQALAFELAADLMTPERSEQKSLLFIGEGSNGKSTYLTALSAFVGSTNIVGLSLQKMESDRFASSRLLGKLANICPDLPSSHLVGTSMFKAVTGGDAINAEYKYRESFEFRPFARLVFSANQVPRSEDATHAFFRRWLVVPFDKTFEGDEQVPRQELDARLSDSKELSGVLNKALDALPGLRRNGFTESESMREAWAEFRAMTDPVSVWLDKNTILDPDALVSRDAILSAYNDAARAVGRATLTKMSFSQALKRLRPGIRDGQRTVNGRPKTWCWLGIGLCTPDPEDPEQGPGAYFDVSPASQPSQPSQPSTNCFLNEIEHENEDEKVERHTQITNKGKSVKAVKVVNGMRPSVAAALDAIRHGNGPRKAFENVLEGTQKLPHLAKSVAYYYGAKRFDGWEEWLDPVAEAHDTLASESD